MKLTCHVLIVLLLIPGIARASSFEELWKSFYSSSLHKKAVMQEKAVTELSLDRAQRHWLPRVFVGGQTFQTDDPGQVFFNRLGQRSISLTDFIPASLNHPDAKTFQTAMIGVDLPLFEGGMKMKQVSFLQEMLKASELEKKARESQDYAELAVKYGVVLVLKKNSEELHSLQVELDKIMARYQVGEENNPVGHSGLLGLKGVGNRIRGLLNEYELKTENEKNWISEKTGKNFNLKTLAGEDPDSFLTTHLTTLATQASSSQLLAQQQKVLAMQEMRGMERARFLPRLGLFGNYNIFSGTRDTANSQSFGLYLQWELFNPDSYGRLGELNANILAQESKLKAHQQDETLMKSRLLESEKALQKTLMILADSELLLGKQAKLSMRLFRSGMLNALQLSEVINRRIDLIENLQKAQAQFVEVKGHLYQLRH